MKILMIESNPYWIKPNGLTKQVDGLARQLSCRFGDEVWILGVAEGAAEEKTVTVQRDGVSYFLLNRLRGQTLLESFPDPRPPMSSWISNNLFVSTCHKELYAFFQQKQFDLIHIHDYFLLNAVELLKKRFSVPVVASVHALNAEQSHFGEGMRNYLLRNADSVITVSHWLREQVLRRFPFLSEKPLCTIYNGIDGGEDTAGGQERRYITFAGRLEHKKGVDILLQAYRAAKEAEPALPELIIMGDGTEMDSLKALCDKLKLNPHVRFTGMLAGTEVHEYLRQSMMHIVPSREEAFGMNAAEAMLEGAPVIASDAGGLAEVVDSESTGLICPAEDTKSYTDAMLRLWNDPKLAGRLARQAKDKALNSYSWPAITAQIRGVYQQVIGL